MLRRQTLEFCLAPFLFMPRRLVSYNHSLKVVHLVKVTVLGQEAGQPVILTPVRLKLQGPPHPHLYR